MKLAILFFFNVLLFVVSRKRRSRTKEVRKLNEICSSNDNYVCEKGHLCEKWGEFSRCKALQNSHCQKDTDCFDHIIENNPFRVRCELDTKTCQPSLKDLNQKCRHQLIGSECIFPYTCDKKQLKCMAGYNAPCGSSKDCANDRKCELSGLLTVKKVCVGLEID